MTVSKKKISTGPTLSQRCHIVLRAGQSLNHRWSCLDQMLVRCCSMLCPRSRRWHSIGPVLGVCYSGSPDPCFGWITSGAPRWAAHLSFLSGLLTSWPAQTDAGAVSAFRPQISFVWRQVACVWWRVDDGLDEGQSCHAMPHHATPWPPQTEAVCVDPQRHSITRNLHCSNIILWNAVTSPQIPFRWLLGENNVI